MHNRVAEALIFPFPIPYWEALKVKITSVIVLLFLNFCSSHQCFEVDPYLNGSTSDSDPGLFSLDPDHTFFSSPDPDRGKSGWDHDPMKNVKKQILYHR